MRIRSLLSSIRSFFPLQLVIIHLQRNQVLLLFWLILSGFVMRKLAVYIGIPSLFLAPEYMGHINFWSFFIEGIFLGSFIIAFNISSYIVNGYLHPFIVAVSHPFAKYALNNFIIPGVFITLFMVQSFHFQVTEEFISPIYAAFNLFGFFSGIVLFILIAFSYFFSANKDIISLFGLNTSKLPKPVQKLIDKDMAWKMSKVQIDDTTNENPEYYFSFKLRIRKSRSVAHYSPEMIEAVLRQHYTNATIYAGFMFTLVTLSGLFADRQIWAIPASASLLLVFTVMLMLFSATHSLFKGWSTTFFIVLFVSINTLSTYTFFPYRNSAYGLDYNAKRNPEETDSMKIGNPITYQQDVDKTIEILEKWKDKNSSHSLQRPKMVIVTTRGGGMKAAMWTYYTLSYIDSVLNGELASHTALITGASGGMFGAAYFRELYLQYQQGAIDNYYSRELLDKLSKDILNPIAYYMVSRDWLFRFQKFNYGSQTYYKDRAYAFEKRFHENTGGILDKRLSDYALPEQEAIIPMMILTPTVITDGRKLLISPQDISYMQTPEHLRLGGHSLLSIEFRRAYKTYNPDSLRFSTALRMNATFPYVAPIVSLPGKTTLNVMDAAYHDNYGITSAFQFLYTFRDWIAENTSGVIFVMIAEKKVPRATDNASLVEQFVEPLSNVGVNMYNLQNNASEQLAEFGTSLFDGDIYFLNFYLTDRERNISLSWHLTKKEKKAVIEAMQYPENQNSIQTIQQLLKAQNQSVEE